MPTKLEIAVEALREIDAHCAMTREEFVMQGPAFACRQVERAVSIARTALAALEGEGVRETYLAEHGALDLLHDGSTDDPNNKDWQGGRVAPVSTRAAVPGVGEVAELIADLRRRADLVNPSYSDLDVPLKKAAELLALLSPSSGVGSEDLSECSASGQVGEGDEARAAGRGEDKVGLGWKLSDEARQQLEKIEQANTHNATGLGSFLVGSQPPEHPNGPGERGEG